MAHLILSRKHRPSGPRRSGRSESGYAYFLALFLMLLMLTASATVMMDMRTQGRRQREDEMIWRGKEFTRAIRLYYRKAGRYPQNVEELQKGLVNIHFVRTEVLTDPMNKDGEGKWRFIYTNPTGQIIGSVRYATLQQMAILDLNGGKIPGVPGSDSDFDQRFSDTPSSQTNESQAQGGSTANANCPQVGSSASSQASVTSTLQIGPGNGPGIGQAPRQTGVGGTGGLGSSFSLGGNQSGTGACPNGALPGVAGMQLASLQSLMEMKPSGPVDSPVVGGFIIGVGSTVDRKSVKVYKGGKKYNEWEFIYNPLEEQALAVQQGIGQAGAATVGGIPGLGLGQPGAPAGQPTGGAGPVQAPPSNPQPPQQP